TFARRATMPVNDTCAECGDEGERPEQISRRRALSRVSMALGAVSAALVAWPIVGVPARRYRAGRVHRSDSATMGGTDRSNGLVASSRGDWRLHCLLGQLHASGLSRALGTGRAALHVPLSRGRLLR